MLDVIILQLFFKCQALVQSNTSEQVLLLQKLIWGGLISTMYPVVGRKHLWVHQVEEPPTQNLLPEKSLNLWLSWKRQHEAGEEFV